MSGQQALVFVGVAMLFAGHDGARGVAATLLIILGLITSCVA